MNIPLIRKSAFESFYSRDGYLIGFDDGRWRLNKDVAFNISEISKHLSEDMYINYREVLSFYIKTGSPAHASNIYSRSKHYLESSGGCAPFGVESLISYRSTLNKKTEWYLGVLRGFIKRWAALGYSGIPGESLIFLNNLRLKGNEKGFAVQSMCPDGGPLTDIELEGVIAATIETYSSGDLSLSDTCRAMILAMTGRRRVQIAALKIKDLISTSVGGREHYYINFPRAKQQEQLWRTEFDRLPIVKDLWILLSEQKASVKAEFKKKLAERFDAELAPELPLFPNMSAINDSSCLKDLVIGDQLHVRSDSIKSAMDRIEKIISVISERTGEFIHLNPIRFRYTLGTNLGREGKGEYVIAAALDHSDTQNAGVYVRNIPEIVERIDKAVALQLAPIAQAFRGVLVATERDAKRGDDPTSRVSNGTQSLGTCGSYGFCGALAPVACYTCSHFQPWLDGPHESVLDGLIRERDRVLESTGDKKIASVNDRLILAVGDVVSRCNAMRDGSNG